MAEAATDVQPSGDNGHWSSTLPAEYQQIPAVKESPDLPTFVKRFNDQSTELGRRIRIPGKDAKPDEVKSVKQKLHEAGLITLPPEKYEINRPESVPEHAWSGELVAAFESVAKKHGLSAEAVNDLLALEAGRFETAQIGLKTDRADAEKALKDEWLKEGKIYEQQIELGGRAAAHLFSQEEIDLLEKTGIGNHPRFLAALAKVGEGLQEDLGVIGETAMTEDAKSAAAEARDIQTNKENPKHALYAKGDKATVDHVNNLLRKAYPQSVTL